MLPTAGHATHHRKQEWWQRIGSVERERGGLVARAILRLRLALRFGLCGLVEGWKRSTVGGGLPPHTRAANKKTSRSSIPGDL